MIESIIVSAITPFLTKTGEKIAEKVGEDIFPLIKRLFIKDEDIKTLENIQKSPTQRNLIQLEQQISEKINENPELLEEFQRQLNLTPVKILKLENIIKSMKILKEELNYLYPESIGSSEANHGDYLNKIALQERKLQKLEKELFNTLNK